MFAKGPAEPQTQKNGNASMEEAFLESYGIYAFRIYPKGFAIGQRYLLYSITRDLTKIRISHISNKELPKSNIKSGDAAFYQTRQTNKPISDQTYNQKHI